MKEELQSGKNSVSVYNRRSIRDLNPFFFFSSRRRHTRLTCDRSSDVCSSDLVVNRGQRVGVPFNRYAPRLPTLPPTDEIDPGDGFLMQRGWTVAFCGWQWDIERQPGLMGLEAPQALDTKGQPIPGRVSIAFQPNEAHSHHLLSHWPLHPPPGRQPIAHQPYPAADLNDPTAELTVRDSRAGETSIVPRNRWRFARVDG